MKNKNDVGASLLSEGLGMSSSQEDCAAFGDALADVFECEPELKAQMIERGLVIPNGKLTGGASAKLETTKWRE